MVPILQACAALDAENLPALSSDIAGVWKQAEPPSLVILLPWFFTVSGVSSGAYLLYPEFRGIEVCWKDINLNHPLLFAELLSFLKD